VKSFTVSPCLIYSAVLRWSGLPDRANVSFGHISLLRAGTGLAGWRFAEQMPPDAWFAGDM
jgi:hypothetical protein